MKQEERYSEHLLIEQAEALEAVLRRAVAHALLKHKQAGNSIASWQDGQVVLIPAEEIVVPDDVAASKPSNALKADD